MASKKPAPALAPVNEPSSANAPTSPPVERPRFIILRDDWGGHLAGKVLSADEDLLSALDVEHVSYRPASERERRLAGLS